MIKKQISKFGFLLLGTAVLTLSACEKGDDHEHNEEELITTVQVTLVPVGGGTTLTYKYEDLDGNGGAAPVAENIVLAPNKTYNVSIKLLNRSVNPAEDLTTEVEGEGTSHRIYYEPSAGSNISVSNLNNDTGGAPLGTTSTWTTTGAATGSIKITLRHYGGNPPNKLASDPVNSSKSSTDAEAVFTTSVQ